MVAHMVEAQVSLAQREMSQASRDQAASLKDQGNTAFKGAP